jgi:hypothetical protein
MGPFTPNLFEEHPWALLVLIILTVECWQLLKAIVAGVFRRLTQDTSGRSKQKESL